MIDGGFTEQQYVEYKSLVDRICQRKVVSIYGATILDRKALKPLGLDARDFDGMPYFATVKNGHVHLTDHGRLFLEAQAEMLGKVPKGMRKRNLMSDPERQFSHGRFENDTEIKGDGGF